MQDTELAFVIADVAKTPAGHKVAWLQLHVEDRGTAAQEGRPLPVGDRIAGHTVQCGERHETSAMHYSRMLTRVQQTICAEGKGLIRAFGWSDLLGGVTFATSQEGLQG